MEIWNLLDSVAVMDIFVPYFDRWRFSKNIPISKTCQAGVFATRRPLVARLARDLYPKISKALRQNCAAVATLPSYLPVTGQPELAGVFLSPVTGQPSGTSVPIAISITPGGHHSPAAGFDGTNFLAVWVDSGTT